MENNCPLSIYETPPVGEAEHLARHCFCHHCTCGNHTCPGELYVHKTTAKSAWVSGYSKDYVKKEPMIVNLERLEKITKDHTPKFTENSTQRLHFVKYDKYEPAKTERDVREKIKMKTTALTSYRSEFLDWKTGQSVLIKEAHLPYRGGMIKSNLESVYREMYRPHSNIRETHKRSISPGPITSIYDPDHATTNRITYKNTASQSSILNKRVPKHRENSSPTPSYPAHFSTIYKSSYLEFKKMMPLTRLR